MRYRPSAWSDRQPSQQESERRTHAGGRRKTIYLKILLLGEEIVSEIPWVVLALRVGFPGTAEVTWNLST